MAALLAGANMAMVGDEVVQFGEARELSSGIWALSELWRGRRGTEDAIVDHPAGTEFILLDEDTAVAIPEALARPGIVVMAAGVGDEAPYPQAVCAQSGRALWPLSPAHVSAARNAVGDTIVSWVRRSRDGWVWRDGVDVPLAEEVERYRVTRTAGSEVTVAEVTTSNFVYSAAARSADLARGVSTIRFAIAQMGSAAVSPIASVSVSNL
jgi:hypothetical protein